MHKSYSSDTPISDYEYWAKHTQDSLANIYATTPKPASAPNEFTLPAPKDSGAREAFPTGSVRDTRSGKGRFDLLPTRALRQLAQHFENGAKKYGDNNWLKGQPLSRYMDSALRHIFAHLEGKRDEPHAVAAVWNLMCLIDTEQRVREGLLPKELLDLPEPPSPLTPAVK